jgi:type I restriction enzyme S subunit
MAGERKYVKFRSICAQSAFGPRFSSDEYAADGNVACLRTMDIDSNGRINFPAMPIAKLDLTRLKNHILRRDDIVITRTGAYLGKVAVFTEFRLPVLAGAFSIYFRLKLDIADPVFVRYFFNSADGQRAIHSIATGSAQPNLNIPNLHSLEVPLPPLAEQKAIAAVLGALDDKIELNRRMNATLEAMARALFQSWFVDFDPVRAKLDARQPVGMDPATAALFPEHLEDSPIGHIPTGWEAAELGQIADVIDCLHAKKPERCEAGQLYLQLNNIRDDGLIDITDSFFVSAEDYQKWISRMEAVAGDCVITNVGRVGAVGQIPEGVKAALGRNITGIRCKAAFPFPTFLIECLVSESMREEIRLKTDSGTILDALNVKSIPKLRFARPSQEIAASFEKLTRPLRRQMEQNISVSRTLATLRDTLLPKLLSGELSAATAKETMEVVR